MSAEKVEKVVNPPQKPVMSSHPAVDDVSVYIRTPISSDPAALTVNVPAGNPNSVCPPSIHAEITYRTILPAAPPSPTQKSSRTIS